VKALKPREIFIGDDFRFGQNRSGTPDYFRRAAEIFGFNLRVLSVGGGGRKRLGSSVIRQLITDGRLRSAAVLLGRPVALYGRVVAGDRRGRMLGYPAANLNVGQEIHPPPGVYVAAVQIGKQIFGAMANIGSRPSFKKNAAVNIEVHLLDFKRNLYNRDIVIFFFRRIRAERSFPTSTALQLQLKRDEQFVRFWFKKYKNQVQKFMPNSSIYFKLPA
jgi:riboflavin kinase / FMN adenylyltransferase